MKGNIKRDNIHQIQCNVPREQRREQKKIGPHVQLFSIRGVAKIKPGYSGEPSRPDSAALGERCFKPASKSMGEHKVKSTCKQLTREGKERLSGTAPPLPSCD